jgi:hypothetical protein
MRNNEARVVEGVVNFSNVTQHDVYKGQSTNCYTLTITMSDNDAEAFASQGVKIKDYKGNKQRKFKSNFAIQRIDALGNIYTGEIPYNSKVRLQYKLGDAHPVHGVPVYLEKVKVLEEAETSVKDSPDF